MNDKSVKVYRIVNLTRNKTYHAKNHRIRYLNHLPLIIYLVLVIIALYFFIATYSGDVNGLGILAGFFSFAGIWVFLLFIGLIIIKGIYRK